MSIINEALKKASKENRSIGIVSMETTAESARRNLELEMARRKTRVNWGPIFVVLVLLLITGPIIAPVFSTPFRRMGVSDQTSLRTPRPAQLASVPVSSPDTRKAQFAIEETPVFAQAGPAAAGLNRTPDLNLTGIMYSPTDSYVLINQRVVKVGDTIQGATLVSVTEREAKLDYQGNQISLVLSD